MAHAFDQLLQWDDKQESDHALIQAVQFLSATTHQHMTMQEIYDMLVYDASKKNTKILATGVSRDPILHRILSKINEIQQKVDDGNYRLHRSLDYVINNVVPTVELRLAQTLQHMEEQLSKASDRLSNDVTELQNKVVALQQSQTTLATAVVNANQRNATDIATLTELVKELRDQSGSGDETVIDAISDKIEATTTSISTTNDQLIAMAAQEDSVDPAPATPPASTPITISPNSATLTPGGTQQFTASEPVLWACNPSLGGSIDANGLYTASSTGTSDTITATATDGSNRSASVSVSIVAA